MALNTRHCERSKAIRNQAKRGLLRRHGALETRVNAPMALRNDATAEQQLHAVLTRMAQLCNPSAQCDLADCRRARKCVGTERRCVWTLPPQITLPRDDVAEWRGLVQRRAQLLAALRPK